MMRAGETSPPVRSIACLMTLHALSHIITGFAGQQVILPVLLAVAALLVIAGQRRAAFWWTLSVVLVLAIMLVAKIAFIPCGRYLPFLDLRSPSGHAASAMAAYGGLAVLFARMDLHPRAGILALVVGLAVAVAIGVSRVVVGAHTPAEVLFGSLIGLIGPALLLSRRDLIRRPLRMRWLLLVVVPLLLGLLLRDVELDAERQIDHVAFELSFLSGLCR